MLTEVFTRKLRPALFHIDRDTTDPDAIDQLVAAGLLAEAEGAVYGLTEAGHDVLAKRRR